MGEKIIIVFLAVIGIAASCAAKNKEQLFYPAFTITEAMKKDANAVCRKYSHEFDLTDYGHATEKVHLVITILNENGDHFGMLVLPYDNSRKVKSISGHIYNGLGLPEEKLKNSAIQDVNYTSDGVIYDDLRMKIADFKITNYPYTVEFNYEMEYNGLIGYPNWQPIDDYQISVEKSSFLVSYPETLNIRVREVKIPDGSRTEKTVDGKHILEWKLDSLTAWREEPMSPELTTQTPQVIIGPTHFIYAGSEGDLSSWQKFGEWISQLNLGRDQLSTERQAEIRQLAGEIKDTLSAVKTLYQYMQKRTRYVGIQLGLGGYQPFPAETVDRVGYGDCKALSNYMKAILNCVGIRSLYTLAGAGSNQGITMPDFPTIAQNNHVILCVPQKKDSIWLECTSQTQPCGFLGTFVAGRKVLLVTPEGGKQTNTPLLTSTQNMQYRTADVKISRNGTMETTAKTTFSGYQYDNVSDLFTESQDDQKKDLLEDISIPGLNIQSFGFNAEKKQIPEASETLQMSAENYASKSGTRLFIPLNIMNRRRSAPSKVENRRNPVIQKYSYHDKDSIVFSLPDGYEVESAPKNKTISSSYGDYSSSVTIDGNRAVYIRDIKVYLGSWPKENYPDVVKFYTDIVNNDKAKLVLKEIQK